MARPQNVLTLDHAPVIGKIYSVPTLRAHWAGVLDDWPVITPAPHTEGEDIWDWHLDYRFLTPAQEKLAMFSEAASDLVDRCREPERPELRWTGSRASRQFTIGGLRLAAFPPVVMLPLKCRRPTCAPEPLAVPWDLSDRYGEIGVAVEAPGGRFLCPHQKMDLTHWPREADGTVICPLHRLRVRCGSKA